MRKINMSFDMEMSCLDDEINFFTGESEDIYAEPWEYFNDPDYDGDDIALSGFHLVDNADYETEYDDQMEKKAEEDICRHELFELYRMDKDALFNESVREEMEIMEELDYLQLMDFEPDEYMYEDPYSIIEFVNDDDIPF